MFPNQFPLVKIKPETFESLINLRSSTLMVFPYSLALKQWEGWGGWGLRLPLSR